MKNGEDGSLRKELDAVFDTSNIRCGRNNKKDGDTDCDS